MEQSYKPQQRQVRARLVSRAGSLEGNFHIPEKRSFLDFLNSPGAFFRMTDVSLAGGRHEEFFAVRRDAVELVIPTCEESELLLNRPAGEFERHEVGCFLDSGVIDGSLGIRKGVRISDYLHKHDGFCLMRDCQTHGSDGSKVPLLFVNTDRLLGVSDEDV